jgi:hypothetical protein
VLKARELLLGIVAGLKHLAAFVSTTTADYARVDVGQAHGCRCAGRPASRADRCGVRSGCLLSTAYSNRR